MQITFMIARKPKYMAIYLPKEVPKNLKTSWIDIQINGMKMTVQT